MLGKEFIADLRRDYRTKKRAIESRLADFRTVYDAGDRRIFEELCYCILTAGSSARMGMRTIDVLRDQLWEGSESELQRRAGACRVRFWRMRPSYIVHTREYLREICGLRMRDLLDSFTCPQLRRDFFAGNKAIKGLGYKETSHFLRNIGFRGYAILDKHIVNSLREIGIVTKHVTPNTKYAYLAIENKIIRFAHDIDIDMDHLDLLLWSRKTGEILK